MVSAAKEKKLMVTWRWVEVTRAEDGESENGGCGKGVKGGEGTGVWEVEGIYSHRLTHYLHLPTPTPTQHPWWITKHSFSFEAPFIFDKNFMWLPLSTMG